ncbi:MAG TPA: kinase [Cyanobacteria bacterium UBA8803]|nr:kinase [Cyanobacteria bacterium UBA9273]HBL58166.1 kinase [Cyanobacteria bacterium UBA8803]
MTSPLICHILIGPPGSGKSTFAAELAKVGNYRIVSTDKIRETFYGDASIQGEWYEIEREVISQIKEAIASHQPIIYDATNAKRSWRMSFLMQLNSLLPPVLWMAWHLKTPLATCKLWNQQRQRRVIDGVIESMVKWLHDFPPLAAEGFAAVNSVQPIPGGFDLVTVQQKINQLARSLTNRRNRTQHSKIALHRYSQLLDFDRLLHLIALIIKYPGSGNLHVTNPTLLETILGEVPKFMMPVEEVGALMAKLHGSIYADLNAIAADLQWLERNGFMDSKPIDSEIEKDQDNLVKKFPLLATHAYSDLEPFQRLLKIIRFILHHPFLPNSGEGNLATLVQGLKDHHVIAWDGVDTVRRDIEKVLKPYQILPEFALRQGYFAGTAILSQPELLKVFNLLQSQAKNLEDPVALSVYEMFRDRLFDSKLDRQEVLDMYPVRAIANRCMIDVASLPHSALLKNLEKLEIAIANGEMLELRRFAGGGRFSGDDDGFFKVWPLQLVFYNHAWYLALECASGKDTNLFRFERLDRLFMGWSQDKRRNRQEQEKSLHKLQKLHEASAGLCLGNSASDQQLFLSTNKAERSKVEIRVELWFNDDKFRFVSEGTKRFPLKQMKMSPPLQRGSASNKPKSLFSLSQTGDDHFPNRFRVILPKWSLFDVDLWRWIVGFGGHVKVVAPNELVKIVKEIGEGICQVYG